MEELTEAALTQCMEQHWRGLVQKLQRMVPYSDAEDVVQLAFLRAFKARKEFAFRCPVYVWLKTIAFNEALQYLRHHKQENRRAAIESLDRYINSPAPCSRGLDEYLQPGDLETLMVAMSLLTSRHQWVLQLRFFEGQSFAEIGKLSGATEACVRLLSYRAQRQLKRYLHRDTTGCLKISSNISSYITASSMVVRRRRGHSRTPTTPQRVGCGVSSEPHTSPSFS